MSTMKKYKILKNVSALIVLGILFGTVFIEVLYPSYQSLRDRQIAGALESTAVPFISRNDIHFFSDNGKCKQIQYGTIETASPQGCAYRENVSDPSGKNIPSFSRADEKIHKDLQKILEEATSKKIVDIQIEYPLLRPEHASVTQAPMGLGFHVSCFFCRVRYVYWPDYKQLPPDIEYEIYYTPLNENWYRVDQDWN